MHIDSTARRALAIASCGALLVLGACQRHGDPTSPGPRPGAARKAARPVESATDDAIAEANRRMAAGVPLGASTAPVDVRFDLGSVPLAGQPFEVSVAVLPAAPAPVLRIDVRGGEGLAIVSPDGSVSIEKVQAGTLERLSVKATSASAGTRVLGVTVTLELPTGTESRNFAFPIVVGSASGAGAPKGPG